MTGLRDLTGASLFGIADLEFRCGAHDWAFARDHAAWIDAHWAKRQAAQPELFDGRMFLATDIAIDIAAGTLRAAAFETSFRTFIAWRESGFPGSQVFNLFSMAALRSADGAFLVGEMAPGTASAGRLYFPAGTPDLSDVVNGCVDLGANVRRELEEETGIPYTGLQAQAGWRVVTVGQRIACMKQLQSSQSTAEIVERFARFRDTERDPELTALVPVHSAADIDPERMPDFMTAYLRAEFASADPA